VLVPEAKYFGHEQLTSRNTLDPTSHPVTVVNKEVMVNGMKIEETYIRKFQNLHRDSIPGRWTEATLNKAPHKPLLLLCVSDLYRENSLRENYIEPTLYIEEAFNAYWQALFESDNPSTFALPFFHLQHDGFWSLVGTNTTSCISDPIITKSPAALRKTVACAKLDSALHDLLRQPAWNCHLRSVIIASNFDPEVHRRVVEL